MSQNEFAAVLQRIKELESSDGAYSDLLKQMHRLAALAPLSVGGIYEKGAKLFRGTVHHTTMPARIDEIWYPPPHRIAAFGRANRPGVSLFYCCFDPAGAFLETRASVGHYAVLGTWQTINPMTLHQVGYAETVLARAGADRKLPDAHRELSARLGPEMGTIRDYLALAFMDPKPSHYRVTAAIADMFMACDGIAGIMYPSVAKGARVDNVALLPEFVRASLKLTEASVIHVEKADQGGIEGNVIARLHSENGGELSWTYTGAGSTTIKPGEGVQLELSPGARKRFESTGRIQIDDRTYEVFPGYSIELVNDEITVFDLHGQRISPVE